MSSPFIHGEQHVRVNNRIFGNLVAWSIEVGRNTACNAEESAEVERIATMEANHELWNGRGFDLDADFPTTAQRELWARIYLDVARGIFKHELGCHDQDYWQAQYIWAAYSVGRLFRDAAQRDGKHFIPASLDNELFGQAINNTPPTRRELLPGSAS